jgi:hypothetical protein
MNCWRPYAGAGRCRPTLRALPASTFEEGRYEWLERPRDPGAHGLDWWTYPRLIDLAKGAARGLGLRERGKADASRPRAAASTL